MKKVLSTVAALGLVAGLASTAAAVEFKMSGKYLVEGAYISNAEATGAVVQTDENTSDAYWLHTFEIKPTMKVNDKISMSSVIRLADDTFWGSQAGGDTTSSPTVTAGNHNDFYLHQLYMDYASPIGKSRFGRTAAGTYGTNFMDADKRADRIMLYPSFLADGPWSTLFYIEKVKDNDMVAAADDQTAADSDTYVARVYYKTDTVDAGLHYGFTNNKTSSVTLATIAGASVATTVLDDQKHQLTAYGNFKMDNYFLNAELTHFMGDIDVSTTESHDYDSWAGMLKVGGKFDALTPSLQYFYAQGQDFADITNNPTNYDVSAALMGNGTGDQFEPLYILTGRHTGMLNNDITMSADGLAMSYSGMHAVVLAADYAVSNQLSLHGAIGWAQSDETFATNHDDEYGWEYNVGAAYKLLDNLTYEAHFGYLDTGDYFSYGATTDTTENVYLMTHSLTMTF